MNAIVSRVSRLSEALAVVKAGAQTVCVAGAHATAEDMRHQIEDEIKGGKKYDNLPNVSSAPGEAPANQLGKLLGSVAAYETLGMEAFGEDGAEAVIGTDYAKYLEFGTSRMAPRPVAGPAFVPGVEASQVAIGEVAAELRGLEI